MPVDTRRADIPPTVAPDDPAYIYFTGGTTGASKGVVDTHRNVLHNIMRYTNTLYITADDRLTLLQAPAFSGAVSSTFAALLNGAATCPYDTRVSGVSGIAQWVRAVRATVYHSVPSIFEVVASDSGGFPDVRIIRLEGDQAWPRHAELFRSKFAADAVLVNGLGATECGLVRQFFMTKGTSLATASVPIGYPVEDMDVFVCDADRRRVPAGEAGEIGVSSRYLASGYWERPDLTAAAFENCAGSAGRAYFTGDVGRMSACGCVELLGRTDMSKKVRGHAVDLAAVKAALESLAGVREAVAVTTEDRPGDVRLVAYFVPDADAPSLAAMRRSLRDSLPGYMVPTGWIPVDAIPLTENGKVDLRALPGPWEVQPRRQDASESPQTPIEVEIARIWAQILSLEQVGRNDDFFELGGDSLSAAQVISRVAERFRVYISHEFLFRSPTVAGMALAVTVQLVGNARADGRDNIVAGVLGEVSADVPGEAG